MTGRTRMLAMGALAMVVATACAEDRNGSEGASGEATVTTELASFGSLLWQIRGHHLVSLELYEAGDTEGAAAHAGHPVHEILSSVEPEIREADPEAADTLGTALETPAQTIASGAPPADLEADYSEALEALETAENLVAGDLAQDPAYRGSVITGLVSTAAAEYGEAIDGTEVGLLIEYQDAYGFTTVAEDQHGQISGDVEAVSEEEAAEIEEGFDALTGALPAVEPPATPAPVEDVDAAAALIGAELEETVGAVAAAPSDPAEIFARIDELLDEIVGAYETGDADGAAELAAEAYLENYELVEADVIELAPDVNAELEPLLGAQLRASIQDGASVGELQAMVDEARSLLDRAEEAVVGGGS